MVLVLAGLIGGVQLLATQVMYTVHKLKWAQILTKMLQCVHPDHFDLAVSARNGKLGR